MVIELKLEFKFILKVFGITIGDGSQEQTNTSLLHYRICDLGDHLHYMSRGLDLIYDR